MALQNNNGRTNQTINSQQVVIGKVRYIKSLDFSGWLWVKTYPTVKDIYLCEFTKILLLTATKDLIAKNKTLFKILEGPYANESAYISTVNEGKCLIQAKRGSGAHIEVTILNRNKLASKPRNGEVHNQLISVLKFNNDKANITLDSDINYKETNKNSPNYGKIMHSSPLPKGIYKILSPQYPKNKNMTEFYRINNGGDPNLKYDTVWFPVEYTPNQNSSFIHVGHLSEGCVTIYQIEKWNSIYSYLIGNRLDKDGKYVGTLQIL